VVVNATAAETPAAAAKASTNSREVARRLAALMYASAAAGDFLRRLEESGLSLSQCKVLTALAPDPGPAPAGDGEPRSAKQVAARIGASLPTVSRAVDALVRRGLVARAEDADDRRVRQLALTEEGERLVRELVARRVDGLAEFVDDLNAAQRRKLTAAVDSLLERAEIAAAYRQLKEDSR
jgi:DNA-binding MarR family transcriptional regulator